eukprot:g684.t1
MYSPPQPALIERDEALTTRVAHRCSISGRLCSSQRCISRSTIPRAKKQAKRDAKKQARHEVEAQAEREAGGKAVEVRTPQPVSTQSSALDAPGSMDPASKVPSLHEVSGWTVEQVCSFVVTQSRALEKCREAFEENGVDGELFLLLGPEELDEIGVTSTLQRKKLLSVLGKIRNS